MKNKYYILLIKPAKGDQWAPVFGNHDFDLVVNEFYSEKHEVCFSTHLTQTTDDPNDIFAVIAKLNGRSIS